MAKISVIIPAYNAEKTIQATIESVLKQTWSDFELILINDASQDGTLNMVAQFQDPRIKIFSFEKSGGNISRNRGLKLSVGEFVSFLDADDIWVPEKLASQLETLQQNTDYKVAYSWTDYIDAQGNFLVAGTHFTANGDVYEQLLINNFLENGSNPLICREAITLIGGFDESLSAAQDWDMWLRLADKFKFVCVPSVHILYRVSANSVSSNLARQEKACLQVLERAYKDRPFDKQIWHMASANLYKYLTCKALQQPFNRHNGRLAAVFLLKNFINDYSRLRRINLTFNLLVKIIVIIFLPTTISTALLTNIKTVGNTMQDSSPVGKCQRYIKKNIFLNILTVFNLKRENFFKNHSSKGFTMVELLVAILVIGSLSAIAVPSWQIFVNTQRLNTAQDEVYRAMRQAQSQAKTQKLTWQASFRENNGIVQWAIHPASVNATNANWNNLDVSVRLDQETTLQLSNGVRRMLFDHMGSVDQPPLGRITLSSKLGGRAKRCVFVSTILGTMRTSREQTTAQDGKYCY